MKKTDGMNIAIKDIGKRKSRSILTAIAIAVGCMLLVSMQAVGVTIEKNALDFINSFGHMEEVMVLPREYNEDENFSHQFHEQSTSGMAILPYQKNIQVNPKKEDNRKEITDKSLAKLEKIKGIKSIIAYEMANASAIEIEGVEQKGKPFTVLGYNPEYKFTGQQEIVAGKDLSGDEGKVIINSDYLDDMGIEDKDSVVGKKITLTCAMPGQVGIQAPPIKIEKTIEGVYKTENSHVPGNIMGMNSLTGEIRAYYEGKAPEDVEADYSMAVLDTEGGSSMNQVIEKINKDMGYTTFNIGEIAGLAAIFTDFVKVILSIGAMIVIIVASAGLVNTITMTIQEKKKWIGIMRSIGAKKGDIVTIFLSQAIFIGIMGAAAGCLLAAAGISLINLYLESAGKTFSIILSYGNISAGFLITVIVAAVAGIIPASKTTKLDVVEIINED